MFLDISYPNETCCAYLSNLLTQFYAHVFLVSTNSFLKVGVHYQYLLYTIWRLSWITRGKLWQSSRTKSPRWWYWKVPNYFLCLFLSFHILFEASGYHKIGYNKRGWQTVGFKLKMTLDVGTIMPLRLMVLRGPYYEFSRNLSKIVFIA